MIKKGFVIGIVVLFLAGSFASGITINLKDSVKKTMPEKILNIGSSSSGLVAHWSFDEGTGNILHDVSGNGYDGTINNANWTNGISGSALEFNGAGNVVFNDITFGTQWSAVYWIKLYSYGSTSRAVLGYDGTEYVTEIWTDSAKVTTANSGGLDECSATSNSKNWTDGNWYHVGITADNGINTYYIDGVNETNDSYYGSCGMRVRAIGGHGDPIHYFDGKIDEICIFDYVLSEEQIQYLYDNSGGPDIVYIDDDFNESTPGWDYDHFDSIQDGIDAVNVNGTVYVYYGTYYENVVIDKSINLIGEDRNSTIIDGGGSGDCIEITSSWVNISYLSTINSGVYSTGNAGIEIKGVSFCKISYCNSQNHGFHNLRIYSSSDCIVTGCQISNGCGISIGESAHRIDLVTCSFYNASLEFRATSTSHLIKNCKFYKSYVAYRPGSNSIIMENSSFSYSMNDYGIKFHGGSGNNNIIRNCTISNTKYGFYGISTYSNNYIYHNNFLNNTYNAYDYGNNIWDNGYPSGGNYWDDYTGNDTDGDCIGDTPYLIPGGDNMDNYPFMKPNGWINEPPNKPIVNGPIKGKPGVEYSYTAVSTDPNCDEIFYIWNWGDGSYSSWLGPYDSGEVINATHSWSQGMYNITVKAKDIHGLESKWSEPLIVTMPRDKSINNLFLRFFENYPFLYQLLQLMLQRLGF